MPDIDIEFWWRRSWSRSGLCDQKKYGAKTKLHKIINDGTHGQQTSSIRYYARALDLPCSDADRICKLIPTMSKAEKDYAMIDVEAIKNKKFRADDMEIISSKCIKYSCKVAAFRSMKPLNQAYILEWSVS